MSERENARGFTLIELIVYVALLGVVLVIVSALLLNSLRTQSTVLSASEATNNGQLVLTSVDTAVRNGSGVEVSDTGKLLIARTVSGGTWVCRAWYYSSTDGGTVYTTTKTSRAAINTATATSTWTLLASRAGSGLPAIFGPVTATAPSGEAVTVSLNLDIKGQAPVTLTTTTAPRLFSTDRGTCF
ncbi:PilW family protein [Leifsonia sp. YAF41]|uniref:PilW family protein n=1 Tax=Leifsonia sp. YAF41 TaxID=3233086 RepID=UPI003F94CE4D